jgi:hypothetical protein
MLYAPIAMVIIDTHTMAGNIMFLNNLSILDLIFNEGRYAVDYLKKQTL